MGTEPLSDHAER